MKCPECGSNLIRNNEQGACLVIHGDIIFEDCGIKHDHTEPCDYNGGTEYTCENGHLVAIPTINKCVCGKMIKGEDGGFGKGIRHPTETLPWQGTADYVMRRKHQRMKFPDNVTLL